MEETEVFWHHSVQVTNLCSVISVIITAAKLCANGTARVPDLASFMLKALDIA